MNYELLATDNWQLATKYERPATSDERRIIMLNKPNLLDAQMNVTSVKTMNYEQITMNNANKNKPNTNPTCRGVASGEAGTNPISKAKKCPKSPEIISQKLNFFKNPDNSSSLFCQPA